MPNSHGDFIWYDLMTSDVDAAQQFYGKILGWTFRDSGQKDMRYQTIEAKGQGIGGVMELTREMTGGGARPCWMGYIVVDDVDASAKSIKDAGGTVHMQPRDIPSVGRVALVTDPQGVMFYIMRPTPPADNPDATSHAFMATKPLVGHCGWNELATSNLDSAVNFYINQFGWRQDEEVDMGPMGSYKLFHHGPDMIAGMMKAPDEMPVSMWSYYFEVSNIDAAVATVKSSGGQIIQEPREVPGGEFTVNGVDPQGASFALVGPRQ